MLSVTSVNTCSVLVLSFLCPPFWRFFIITACGFSVLGSVCLMYFHTPFSFFEGCFWGLMLSVMLLLLLLLVLLYLCCCRHRCRCRSVNFFDIMSSKAPGRMFFYQEASLMNSVKMHLSSDGKSSVRSICLGHRCRQPLPLVVPSRDTTSPSANQKHSADTPAIVRSLSLV